MESQNDVEQKPSEEETRGRGRGQAWGRRRPRGPRTRPRGHFQQRDIHTAEMESSLNNPDKFISAGFNPASDQIPPPHDWDAGQPPEGSFLPSHNSSHPQYNSQESREGGRGQRSTGGRGHSRPKYVTVPDASRSHDVRHVEELNDSIVINIDCSAKSASEPIRRGRGVRGSGARGAGGRSEFSVGAQEDDADSPRADRDDGIARGDTAPHSNGYRGRGGRRPFRGQGDGSHRGQGRGDGGFRRGRGDGSRPFRGGFRGDRSRGGRGARRTVIQVVASPGGDVGSSYVQEEEDWDKEAAEAGAAVTDGGDCGWQGGEADETRQEEHQNLDDLDDGGDDSRFYDDSLASGICDNEDGNGNKHDEEQDHDSGQKTKCLAEKKEIGEQVGEVAVSNTHPSTEVEESISEVISKGMSEDLAGVKLGDGAEGKSTDSKQNSDPKTDVKVGNNIPPDPTEIALDAAANGNTRSDSVTGNIVEDVSNEMKDASKEVKSENSCSVQPPNAAELNSAELNSSTLNKSDESKTKTISSVDDSNSSESSGLDLSLVSIDAISEIPASVDKKT